MYVTNAAWTFSTAWIGVASTFGGFPLFPAIDWGDGSTVPFAGYGPSTGIPVSAYNTTFNGSPAHVYVGAFSHTYGLGQTTILVTVHSVNGIGTTAGQAPPIITGSLVGSVTPTLGNTYYFLRNITQAFIQDPPCVSCIDVDTTTDLGLILLALALAAAALVMMKR